MSIKRLRRGFRRVKKGREELGRVEKSKIVSGD